MDNNFYQIINPITILLALGITFLISYIIGKYLNISGSFIGIIYLWHLLFMLVYLWFVSDYGGDIIGYWDDSFTNKYDFTPGTKFIISLVKIFSVLLGFDFVSTNIIFMNFGVLAILFLTRIYLDIFEGLPFKYQIFPLIIIFFPSLSYWSSSIGKDGLALLSCTLSLYYFSYNQKSLIPLVMALLMMVVVRPYIFVLMLTALFFTYLFFEKKILKKLFILGVFVFFVIMMGLILPDYYGLGENFLLHNITFSSFLGLLKSRQLYNLDGVSFYDVSSLSFFEMIFAYMYTPFFFNAPGIFGLFASIENLLLLIFIIFSLFGYKNIHSSVGAPIFLYSFIFFISLLLLFSFTTNNMGIAIRQKTMLLPFYFYCTASLIALHCKNNRFLRFNILG